MGWFGWAVAGLVGLWVLVLGTGTDLPTVFRLNQPEGAYALGVAFFWSRVLAILAAVIAGVMGGRRG